ncbi:hypothetical protein K438DRAFT_1946086 [Mycena galopus ATCC 62051]|nr:hypothetical protein K438DRAFT_1946086 [Mycena galopus ATCC 62051]
MRLIDPNGTGGKCGRARGAVKNTGNHDHLRRAVAARSRVEGRGHYTAQHIEPQVVRLHANVGGHGLSGDVEERGRRRGVLPLSIRAENLESLNKNGAKGPTDLGDAYEEASETQIEAGGKRRRWGEKKRGDQPFDHPEPMSAGMPHLRILVRSRAGAQWCRLPVLAKGCVCGGAECGGRSRACTAFSAGRSFITTRNAASPEADTARASMWLSEKGQLGQSRSRKPGGVAVVTSGNGDIVQRVPSISKSAWKTAIEQEDSRRTFWKPTPIGAEGSEDRKVVVWWLGDQLINGLQYAAELKGPDAFGMIASLQ